MLEDIAIFILLATLWVLFLFMVFWGILGILLFGIHPPWVPVIALPMCSLGAAGVLVTTQFLKDEFF